MRCLCMKGLFITFEGGEGTGKSTLINMLKEYFTENNFTCVLTREPGGTPVSEQIRNVILDINNNMSSITEALLYAASRVEHLDKLIIPAIQNGQVVISDRYLDSSLVYQGCARNLGFDKVLEINKYALDYLPDKTFFIDVKPSVALARIKNNHREMDRLDLEKMEFHERVYNGYIELAKKYPDRIVRINGDDKVENVFNKVLEEIKKIIR